MVFKKLVPVIIGTLMIFQIITAFVFITPVMAILGCLVILFSAIRLGLKGGIYSATLCSIFVLTGHIFAVLRGSSWSTIIITVLLYYVLGVGIGWIIGKRAAELVLANRELIFQNKEKEKRAEELLI